MLSFQLSYDRQDIDSLVSITDLIERNLEVVVQDTGNLLVAEWHKEATVALKHAGGYTQGIDEGIAYPFESDPLHFVVIHTQDIAVYLEEGTVSRDMKAILANHGTPNKTDGKRYIRIPFEHARASLIKAGVDESEINDVVARAKAGERPRLTDMGGVGVRRKYFIGNPGLRRLTMEQGIGRGGRPLHYQWKSSPFEGAMPMIKSGQAVGFKTFRTMSEKSDPNSWIHPGIRAMHIAENAANTVEPIFERACDEAIDRAIEEAQTTSFQQAGS